jgi:signal transduction histidine kinase
MAQDAVAPHAQEQRTRGWAHAVIPTMRGWLNLLPSAPTLPAVEYTPRLVAYVGAVVAGAIGVGALAVHGTFWAVRVDPWTLAVGGLTIFLMAVYAIRLVKPANISWAPTVFVQLGLAVTLGPAGAAVGAITESLGVSVRNHNGWFRTAFNVANQFLANTAAWAVFRGIDGPVVHGDSRALVAGLAAGCTHFALNSGFVAFVIHVSDRKASVARVLLSRTTYLPYSIGYGFAAFTFKVMEAQDHTVGFLALLAPVILLHGFLIVFTRRVAEYERQQEADRLRKAQLSENAIRAHEAERRRIARDLHDGVVQNLAGINFALSAEASHLKTSPAVHNGNAEMLELLETTATQTRGAMKDLRTLIIELVPPTLRREGLQAALIEVLREVERKGTSYELDLQPTLRLREDRAALFFRVAQEILRNVAAHAQAKNVKVDLATEDGSAILSVQDDGKGFSTADMERRRAEGHLGTAAIVELAEEAGGTLTIDSEPGRGTLVVLTLPIE